MTILLDTRRPVKPARARRFGAGLLAALPTVRHPAPTQADRDWASRALNADAADFDVIDAAADRMAEESAEMDRLCMGLCC